ncbi:MAG: hypothetical protein EAZ07_08385 [Cytophagales bacterium]|nr:MAG: hypothetical protein EAZ07_08385 [Cytophagales bacterium]
MRKISVILFAMLLVFQTTSSFANSSKPRGKKGVNYANVNAEIKDILDAKDFGDIKPTSGKVMLKYYVDNNNIIHILDIKGSNSILTDYVQSSLEGTELYNSNIIFNKEVVVKLNFDLQSN